MAAALSSTMSANTSASPGAPTASAPTLKALPSSDGLDKMVMARVAVTATALALSLSLNSISFSPAAADQFWVSAPVLSVTPR